MQITPRRSDGRFLEATYNVQNNCCWSGMAYIPTMYVHAYSENGNVCLFKQIGHKKTVMGSSCSRKGLFQTQQKQCQDGRSSVEKQDILFCRRNARVCHYRRIVYGCIKTITVAKNADTLLSTKQGYNNKQQDVCKIFIML